MRPLLCNTNNLRNNKNSSLRQTERKCWFAKCGEPAKPYKPAGEVTAAGNQPRKERCESRTLQSPDRYARIASAAAPVKNDRRNHRLRDSGCRRSPYPRCDPSRQHETSSSQHTRRSRSSILAQSACRCPRLKSNTDFDKCVHRNTATAPGAEL